MHCMDILHAIIASAGAFAVCIVDVLWWHIDYKKAERGMEAHEHYHVGLELLIASYITSLFYEPVSWLLVGMGITFIAAEWRQVHEIKKGKVVPGHPFAYGSSHFASSTIIGVVLCAVLAAVILLIN